VVFHVILKSQVIKTDGVLMTIISFAIWRVSDNIELQLLPLWSVKRHWLHCYLCRLYNNIEVDKDGFGDGFVARWRDEQDVSDTQEREQDESGPHCFPTTQGIPIEYRQPPDFYTFWDLHFIPITVHYRLTYTCFLPQLSYIYNTFILFILIASFSVLLVISSF